MKNSLTPSEAVKRFDDLLGTKVGLQFGSEVAPGGAITRLTESGKTIKTDRGLVFKFRRSLGKFTLKGVPEVECIVFSPHAVFHRETPAKRGPGRPKGSKNKPKIEALTTETLVQEEASVKRGRGRPKGSKNRPKVAKRGPGRPKGSKNKPKVEHALQALQPTQGAVKRGPGRPKGSKNKPKPAVQEAVQQSL